MLARIRQNGTVKLVNHYSKETPHFAKAVSWVRKASYTFFKTSSVFTVALQLFQTTVAFMSRNNCHIQTELSVKREIEIQIILANKQVQLEML